MTLGLAAQVYVLSNILIGLGYLAVPALVLPYLALRRRVIVFGVMFFVGCFGSHADMVYDVLINDAAHTRIGWVAAFWHLMQAIGTWGFIVFFRHQLAAATALLERVEAQS